jgi:hypothetical protein
MAFALWLCSLYPSALLPAPETLDLSVPAARAASSGERWLVALLFAFIVHTVALAIGRTPARQEGGRSRLLFWPLYRVTSQPPRPALDFPVSLLTAAGELALTAAVYLFAAANLGSPVVLVLVCFVASIPVLLASWVLAGLVQLVVRILLGQV